MDPRRALAAVCLLAGCLRGARDDRALLDDCRFNDDCRVPLVCAAARCRAPCRSDRDCANGGRCLSAGQPEASACYAPDDYANACRFDSECRGGRVCGGDGVCRAQCLTDYDCAVIAPGLRCLAQGVCSAHPFLDGGVLPDVDLNALRGSADAAVSRDASAPVDAGAWPACAQRRGGCLPGVDAGCRVVEVVTRATTCARISDGTVRCWGAGPARGTGSVDACPVPGVVPDLTGVTQLAVGADFACARRADAPRPIWCWGNDTWGQLGRGGVAATTPQTPAAAPTLPDGEVSLTATAGGFVVPAPGTWWAFGWNTAGTFGNGTSATLVGGTRPPPSSPVEVMAPGAVEVRGGQVHACARYADGTVSCWGRNDYGELGNGTSGVGATPVPTSLPFVAQVRALAVGTFHACALRVDGTVLCWGAGSAGQLGRGAPTLASSPMAMIVGSDAVTDADAVFAGGNTTCVRRAAGAVWCTGADLPGVTAPQQSLTRVAALDGARVISLSSGRGCALFADGALRCWGSLPGALGVGTAMTPVDVTF